jgi:dephospho-CoA kinase
LLKVGLTGGIGSGKSTVAAIFEVLGIPVYYADAEAKKMMNEDEAIINTIKKIFGEESYQSGKLNREYISSIVFSNPEKLKELNSIIHPATISGALKWMNQQTTPYSIKEAALIFESYSEKDLDYIIGVTAPEEIRIKRAMMRDDISKEKVEERIKEQMNEVDKMNLCNFIINNDETILLIPQVIAIHEHLLQIAEYGEDED